MRVIVHEEKFGHFPLWYNENSPWLLRYNDLSQEMLLTLNDHFPLIPDFEIILESYKGSIRGYKVNFFSQEKEGGIMNTLFSDEHLRREGFAPPLNFDDLDQGWTLTIVTKNEFVYLWEGNFDYPDAGIQRWFKVPKERYYAEWLAAITASIQLSEDETEQERLRRLAPPGQSLYGIQMLSAHNGWAIGGSFDQNGHLQNGCILQYQDGKWMAQQVEVPLLALAFLSEQDGWAVGAQGAMFHFDGHDWKRQPNVTDMTLRGVAMTTQRSWAIGDQGTILYLSGRAGWTHDTYKTYTHLKIPPLEIPLHCIIARWSNDAWIVGDNGKILNTTKKGWEPMWSLAYHLNSLSLSSSGSWWAVGEKGIMVQCKTRSYHASYRLEIGSLYSVSMLSEEDGWCFGAKGLMLRYNGSTWEVQVVVSSKDLRGSHFLSPLEGWCVGQDNTILHYRQGIWTKEDVE